MPLDKSQLSIAAQAIVENIQDYNNKKYHATNYTPLATYKNKIFEQFDALAETNLAEYRIVLLPSNSSLPRDLMLEYLSNQEREEKFLHDCPAERLVEYAKWVFLDLLESYDRDSDLIPLFAKMCHYIEKFDQLNIAINSDEIRFGMLQTLFRAHRYLQRRSTSGLTLKQRVEYTNTCVLTIFEVIRQINKIELWPDHSSLLSRLFDLTDYQSAHREQAFALIKDLIRKGPKTGYGESCDLRYTLAFPLKSESYNLPDRAEKVKPIYQLALDLYPQIPEKSLTVLLSDAIRVNDHAAISALSLHLSKNESWDKHQFFVMLNNTTVLQSECLAGILFYLQTHNMNVNDMLSTLCKNRTAAELRTIIERMFQVSEYLDYEKTQKENALFFLASHPECCEIELQKYIPNGSEISELLFKRSTAISPLEEALRHKNTYFLLLAIKLRAGNYKFRTIVGKDVEDLVLDLVKTGTDVQPIVDHLRYVDAQQCAPGRAFKYESKLLKRITAEQKRLQDKEGRPKSAVPLVWTRQGPVITATQPSASANAQQRSDLVLG